MTVFSNNVKNTIKNMKESISKFQNLRDSDTEFIKTAYQEILGREIDKKDLELYTEMLQNGYKRTNFLINLVKSEEFINKYINYTRTSKDNLTPNSFDRIADKEDLYYCYRLILGRNPDLDGWNTWFDAIKNKGTSIDTLVIGFLSSPEFKNRNLVSLQNEFDHQIVDLDGFKMDIPKNDWAVGKTILEQRSYEPHVTNYLKRFVSPGMTFVDIGANIGYFSMMAASIVGSFGKVFAFEPNQHNCQFIFNSASINGFNNIVIYPFAVAEKMKNFIYDNLGTNGIISEIKSDNTATDRTIVMSIVLDELLDKVDRIDTVKIDIEGAEYKALAGAKNIIQKHRPVILSEFSPSALNIVSQVSGETYLQSLINHNYHISVIEESGKSVECQTDITKIINIFDSRKASHIDIVAHPL